ncbi:MAG: hypothetical protein HYT94_02015 [Parcubacteria group bacterium]|nr:hypothetical protein [Parcubacteria group bacterium]
MDVTETLLSPAALAVKLLIERMAGMPVYELRHMKPEMKILGEQFPEYAGFLAQEPADVPKRYQMGKKAQCTPSRY